MQQATLFCVAIVFLGISSLCGYELQHCVTEPFNTALNQKGSNFSVFSRVIKNLKQKNKCYPTIMMTVAFWFFLRGCKQWGENKQKRLHEEELTQRKREQVERIVYELFGIQNAVDELYSPQLNINCLKTLLEQDSQLLSFINPPGIDRLLNAQKQLSNFCALEIESGLFVSCKELYKTLFLFAGLTLDTEALKLLCTFYADHYKSLRYGCENSYSLSALLTVLVPESKQKGKCLELLRPYDTDSPSDLLNMFSSGLPEFIGNTHTIDGQKAQVLFKVNGRSVKQNNNTVRKNIGKIWTFLATEYPLSVHCHGDFTVEIWTGDFLDSLDPKHTRYFLNQIRSKTPSQREDEFYCYLNEEIDRNRFTDKNPYCDYIWEIVYKNNENGSKYHSCAPLKKKRCDPTVILGHEWDTLSTPQKELTNAIHARCKKVHGKLQKLRINNKYLELTKEETDSQREQRAPLSFDPPGFICIQSSITCSEYATYLKQLIENRLTSLEALETTLSNLIRSTHLNPEDTTALIRQILYRGANPDNNNIVEVFKTLHAGLDHLSDNKEQSNPLLFINSRYDIARFLLYSGAPIPPTQTYETISEKIRTRIRVHLENEQRTMNSNLLYQEGGKCLTNILKLITDEQRLRQQFTQLNWQTIETQKKLFDLLLTTIDALDERSEDPGLWIQHVTQFSKEGWKLLFETINTLCSATAWNGYQCTTMRRTLSLLLALTTHKPVSEQCIPLVQNCVKRIIEEGDRKQLYEYDQYHNMQPVLIRCIKRISEIGVPSVFKRSGTNIFHIFAQSGFDNVTLKKAIKYIKKHHSLELLSIFLQKKQSPLQFLNEQYTPLDLALKYSLDQETGRKNKKVDSALQLMKQGVKECVDFYEKSDFILPQQFEKQIHKAKKLLQSFSGSGVRETV